MAGSAQAVDRLLECAKAAGAKRAVRLPISAPVHSSLMRPAAKRMQQRLAGVTIRSPRVPVLHNHHIQAESEPDSIRQALVAQIDAPVRWGQTISTLAQAGVDTIVECGPGKILTGLNRRIDRELHALSMHDDAGLRAALATAK